MNDYIHADYLGSRTAAHNSSFDVRVHSARSSR
jgi:hypothetical protein